MGRRRRGRRIDGWLVLDKPEGLTSARAVDEVKAIVKPQKAGHAGTLDPLATGVLMVALGEATKTVPYLMSASKHYRFTVSFGEERDTDDAEGRPVQTSARRPGTEEVEAVLGEFTGELQQVPPTFAAIKIGGERAYDLARRGERVALEARTVRVERLELLGPVTEGRAELALVCGKGTYVRAIARDLGRRLGCYGYVSRLRRTRLGPFPEEEAVGLDALREADERRALFDLLRPVGDALADLPAVVLAPDEVERLRSGQTVHVGGALDEPGPTDVRVLFQDRAIAIASYAHGVIRPVRVLTARP
jgi:tRNA pseudouridine55 synthase